MKSKAKKKIITICSSVTFYRQVLDAAEVLKKLGFKVIVPITTNTMKKTGNFNENDYKTWYKNKDDYHLKTKLMKDHFKKVVKADAILVINHEKKGISGYIGGNVLMEMVLAFHYKKKIFILNKVEESLSFYEEIYGMKPVFINGNLQKLLSVKIGS